MTDDPTHTGDTADGPRLVAENGGLAVRATYMRGFSRDYNLATLTGGLVFTL